MLLRIGFGHEPGQPVQRFTPKHLESPWFGAAVGRCPIGILQHLQDHITCYRLLGEQGWKDGPSTADHMVEDFRLHSLF